MKVMIDKIYNHQRSDSLASNLRRKRFAFFQSLLESLPTPIKLLDVGGTVSFWQNTNILHELNKKIDITVVNLYLEEKQLAYPNIKQVFLDARNMKKIENQEFDVAFSNSVIEHVGGYEQQLQMARELVRVSKRHFVQTPNLYFPIEPHFVFPFFQFLPIELRVLLLSNFDLGWMKKIPDKQEAKKMITGIRLLTKMELTNIFPNSNILEEKFLGLTKSFIIYNGWDT